MEPICSGVLHISAPPFILMAMTIALIAVLLTLAGFVIKSYQRTSDPAVYSFRFEDYYPEISFNFKGIYIFMGMSIATLFLSLVRASFVVNFWPNLISLFDCIIFVFVYFEGISLLFGIWIFKRHINYELG